MKWILLGLQGGLNGYVAGTAFPGLGWEFFSIVFVNAVLVVWYGIFFKF